MVFFNSKKVLSMRAKSCLSTLCLIAITVSFQLTQLVLNNMSYNISSNFTSLMFGVLEKKELNLRWCVEASLDENVCAICFDQKPSIASEREELCAYAHSMHSYEILFRFRLKFMLPLFS